MTHRQTPWDTRPTASTVHTRVATRSRPTRKDDRFEREPSEAGLRESERLFRATFERAAIGIAHVSPEGHLLRVNRRLCDLLGYSRAELTARTWQDLTHPDDLDVGLANVRRLLAGEIDEYATDKRYVRQDGGLVWAYLTLALVRTPTGAPDYIIAMVQDIGARKRLERERARLLRRERAARAEAEAALALATASEARAAERAEQLRAILETMADGVAVVDSDGRLIQTNRACRELIAMDQHPAFDAAPPEERCSLLDAQDAATGAPLPAECLPSVRALRGETVTGPGADYRVRAFDGRELEVNISAATLRDGAGHIAGAVLVLRDVTERNRLAREREAARARAEAARADALAAREVNRRMEQFLAVAAHDLRAPVTATLGFLDLAERQFQRLAPAVAARGEGPDRGGADLARLVAAVRDSLDDADRGAERLARLVAVLFDTAALRAGRLELRRVPSDLAALVREQVVDQRILSPHRAIRLHTPAGGRPVAVEVDADRIGQVVSNYLSNALKYSPPDRPVDVSVGVRRGQARVAVRDAGPGLPEAEQALIWEPFHRAPDIAAQGGEHVGVQGGSLGLGLDICKAIVEAHGGDVGVESAVGAGSTFWFTLPPEATVA